MKNLLNDVIRGASTQFGREFGRAGANAILKGKIIIQLIIIVIIRVE